MKPPRLMVIFRLGVSLLFSFCLSCSNHRDQPATELIINSQIVQRVDVLEVPRTVSTQKGFTSDSLLEGYHLKLELRAGALLDRLDALQDANAATQCVSSGHTDDVRTAILFYGADSRPIHAVYYGLDPVFGTIDSRECRLTPALYKWVRKQISE